nr:MAG TPA: hypothetical protein [Caudoviricetes sp.]
MVNFIPVSINRRLYLYGLRYVVLACLPVIIYLFNK